MIFYRLGIVFVGLSISMLKIIWAVIIASLP